MSPVISTDQTIYQALRTVCAAYPERTALTFKDETLTYAQVGTRLERLARGLRALGVGPGDTVAMMLPSCLEAPLVFFAPAALGAVIVPMNPLYRQKEMHHILSECQVSVIVTERKPLGNDVAGILETLRPSLPHLKHVILRGAASGGMPGLDDLPNDDAALPAQPVSSDALANLVYTSGTTGVQKAVMHSHRGHLAAVLANQIRPKESLPQMLLRLGKLTLEYGPRYLKYGSKPITSLSFLPLHTLFGYGASVFGLLMGFHIVILERFHPPQILEAIEKYRINAFAVSPTMLLGILDSPDRKKRDLSSLLMLYASTAPVPPDLVRRARAELGCPVLIAFGTTEAGGSAMMGNIFDPDDLKSETVGKKMEGVEAKIVDEQHETVPQGEMGELALRLSSRMMGYYKAPELTAATLDKDGWYYTGDLATMDAKGYFRIVGRKKEMIIRGGQNIFPAEIENFLVTKPEIGRVAIVGVPDRIAGERVWAFVQPKADAQITPAQILAYCRSELAPYKVPDQVRVVTEMPLTPTGKVQKFILREQALSEQVQTAQPAPTGMPRPAET